jgi:hypothetical protein
MVLWCLTYAADVETQEDTGNTIKNDDILLDGGPCGDSNCIRLTFCETAAIDQPEYSHLGKGPLENSFLRAGLDTHWTLRSRRRFNSNRILRTV